MIGKSEDRVHSGPGTIIGANVKLVGTLKDANDIVVHGTVEGEVISEKAVTIGETARIKGPVSAATVSVAGLLRGSIEASVRIEILPTGKVNGNIATKDLIIRSGAQFIGKSEMRGEHESDAPEVKEASTEQQA